MRRLAATIVRSLHAGLAMVLLVMSGGAVAAPTPLPGVVLNSTSQELELVPWATIVKDPDQSKALDEVLQAPPATRGSTEDNTVSFGFSSAAYWFVVPLKNTEAYPLVRSLYFEPTWLDHVEVTLVHATGGQQTYRGGDALPYSERATEDRRINFALTLPPGPSTLVVRISTVDPFFVRMTLFDFKAAARAKTTESLYFGLLYGSLISLLLFNFSLFVSTHDKSYLAYSVYLASFMVMHATYNGHAFGPFFAEHPAWSNWAHSISIYLYLVFGIVFAIVFLHLKETLPSSYRMAKLFLAGLAVSFALTALLDGYRANVISSIIGVVLYTLFVTSLGIRSLTRRNKVATYFLSASIAGLVGSSLTAFTVMGVLSYTFMHFRAVDFGVMLDALMLSLALAERVKRASRLERLRRFFSPAVADKLLSANSTDLYRPHRREIVVLFLDLRGYTAFSLKHDADEVMRVLGEFHTAMGELISAYGATLERFAGDGMMIFLNDPEEIPDPAGKACRMALDMQDRFARLDRIWRQRGYSLAMGVGIAQGVATIGAIGFEGRRDYGAIGNVTNLSARLCAEARGGQIVVSSEVARNVHSSFLARPLARMTLKGFDEPVECYELVVAGDNPTSTQTTIEQQLLA